jgi:hypothetical protein
MLTLDEAIETLTGTKARLARRVRQKAMNL